MPPKEVYCPAPKPALGYNASFYPDSPHPYSLYPLQNAIGETSSEPQKFMTVRGHVEMLYLPFDKIVDCCLPVDGYDIVERQDNQNFPHPHLILFPRFSQELVDALPDYFEGLSPAERSQCLSGIHRQLALCEVSAESLTLAIPNIDAYPITPTKAIIEISENSQALPDTGGEWHGKNGQGFRAGEIIGQGGDHAGYRYILEFGVVAPGGFLGRSERLRFITGMRLASRFFEDVVRPISDSLRSAGTHEDFRRAVDVYMRVEEI